MGKWFHILHLICPIFTKLSTFWPANNKAIFPIFPIFRGLSDQNKAVKFAIIGKWSFGLDFFFVLIYNRNSESSGNRCTIMAVFQPNLYKKPTQILQCNKIFLYLVFPLKNRNKPDPKKAKKNSGRVQIAHPVWPAVAPYALQYTIKKILCCTKPFIYEKMLHIIFVGRHFSYTFFPVWNW